MNSINVTLISSLNKNQNLSQFDRDRIPIIIKDFENFFSNYNVSINMEDISKLLETVTFRKINDKQNSYHYDYVNNSINFYYNTNITEAEAEANYCLGILSLMCTSYNVNTGYTNGVCFKIDNVEYANIINEKLKNRIFELTYGNIDSKVVTLPTPLDKMIYDIESIIEIEDLLTYFINGRGDLFYSRFLEYFDEENECIDFFRNLNKYDMVDSNDVMSIRSIDKKYETQLKEIMNKKNVNKLVI